MSWREPRGVLGLRLDYPWPRVKEDAPSGLTAGSAMRKERVDVTLSPTDYTRRRRGVAEDEAAAAAVKMGRVCCCARVS